MKNFKKTYLGDSVYAECDGYSIKLTTENRETIILGEEVFEKLLNIINDTEILNYDIGFLDGLRCFAHWKDGEEYVGTTGETLQGAIEKRKKLWNYRGKKNE